MHEPYVDNVNVKDLFFVFNSQKTELEFLVFSNIRRGESRERHGLCI